MRSLDPAELLEFWDRAAPAPPLLRPLAFLAAAEPACPLPELAAEPLGRRDARLLDAHEALMGPAVSAVAACPRCAEQVELSFTVDEVRARGAAPEATHVAAAGYDVWCRPPTTGDLQAAAAAPDGVRALLDRCVATAAHGDHAVAAADLPPEVVDAIDDALERADPQADVLLELTCPACATSWSAPFDIASFLWDEIAALATRTLADVDVLARAYGWREADILALTPARRERYLELVLG